MSSVLATQTAIRRGIRDVFADRRQRRVAFVAFVGRGAQVYTGNPKGLTVVCWPRAGGTNPHAVEALRRKGAHVYFADRLHMKVYWSPRGAIIGSPNLSSNALGAGDLRECAVRVPSTRVDVDALWRSLDPRPVDRSSLAKLHEEHAEYRRRNKSPGRQSQPRRTFADWHRDGSRERWAFSWWDSVAKAAKRARALAAEFGSDTVENFVACGKGELSKDTWVLLGKKSTRGMFANPQWLYVHGVVLVDASERRGGASGYAIRRSRPARCACAPGLRSISTARSGARCALGARRSAQTRSTSQSSANEPCP
jgi:hypothetical protein